MKLNLLAITLLSLICINMATTLFKEKKVLKKVKKSSKTKGSYGSGTWKDGYDCPDLKIAVGDGEYKTEGRAKFFATKLESPVDVNEQLGWVFEFSSGPGNTLKKILTQVGTSNKWYIPFRWISSTPKYTNPVGYKYIEFWVTPDEKTTSYRFRINLPWAYVGWYINDTEGNKICSLLNSERTKHQNILNEAKSSAIMNANTYITSKPLYEAAMSSGSNLEKAKKDLLSKKTTLEGIVKTLTEERNQLKAKIDELTRQVQAQQAKVNTYQTQLATFNGQVHENNETLKTIGSSTTSTESLINTIKSKIEAAVTSVKTHLESLKKLCSNRLPQISSSLPENIDQWI